MEPAAGAVGRIVELALLPFDRLPAMLGLTLVSLVTGGAIAWVTARTTARARLQRARDRMVAAVYEARLFLDSPRRMLRAQGRLIGNAALYLVHLGPAMAVLAAPLGLLYLHLELRHGVAPLPVGAPVIVRITLDDGVDGDALAATAGEGLRITAPPLYDQRRQQVVLRAQLDGATVATLAVEVDGARRSKQLVAASDRVPAPERARGWRAWITAGAEPPLPDGPVRAISVRHPGRAARYLGLPWWLFWLLLAAVGALLVSRRR